MPGKPNRDWSGLFHLLVVYIVWGTTYLGIRIAVREGAGFPPFAMGAMRLLVAGAILLIAGRLSGGTFRIARRDLVISTLSGILLWSCSNGLVMWGEQRANSGHAALLVSTAPLWVTIIESFLDRKMPSRGLGLSLLLGFAGVGVLTVPALGQGGHSNFLDITVLTIAPVMWAAGSVFQKRNPVQLNPLIGSACQQIAGGIGFVFAAAAFREPLPTPTASAWFAWAYLVVFGSLLAYTSFTLALKRLPTNIVMTYSYVNPVVAVFLGWLILREPITLWTVGGTALVLLGVAGTFKEQYSKAPSTSD